MEAALKSVVDGGLSMSFMVPLRKIGSSWSNFTSVRDMDDAVVARTVQMQFTVEGEEYTTCDQNLITAKKKRKKKNKKVLAFQAG